MCGEGEGRMGREGADEQNFSFAETDVNNGVHASNLPVVYYKFINTNMCVQKFSNFSL